jgi:hypothetical protein
LRIDECEHDWHSRPEFGARTKDVLQCANANRNDHPERTILVFGGEEIFETKLVFWATKPIKIEMLHVNRILFGGVAIYRTTQR